MQPIRIGVQEARRRLPELLERASTGEEIVIQRHKKPLARLISIHTKSSKILRQCDYQIESLMELKGSASQYWGEMAQKSRSSTKENLSSRRFIPSELVEGSRIAVDGSALVAFLTDAKGTGDDLQPLMQGIAQGTWHGVISSLSLLRVLEGPLAHGDEALTQRYAAAFSNPQHWLQVPADGALVLAAARLQRQEPQLDQIRALELATAIAAQAKVLVTNHPSLAQTCQHPVLSVIRR